MSNAQHWDNIYLNKADKNLGWFEQNQDQSLAFIKNCQLPNHYFAFIAGAGRSFLVDEIIEDSGITIINDISQKALAAQQQRVNSKKLTLLHHDLGLPLNKPTKVDLWIDRAVLHFLLEPSEIKNYFSNLRNSLNIGGYVLLAQFSKSGAKQCAGLKIKQYDCQSFQQQLGSEFELIKTEEYNFSNPFGDEKPYIYALFKKCH